MPDPLVCHRCGRDLTPGGGDWYVVNIEAFADPTPPTFTDEDLAREAEDIADEMQHLIEQMERGKVSEREMMDEVHRRVTLHLCRACYRRWIESPV
ncbi:MAG: hypothetical protein WD009_13715 [Phycisphaeraceae bacterium]